MLRRIASVREHGGPGIAAVREHGGPGAESKLSPPSCSPSMLPLAMDLPSSSSSSSPTLYAPDASAAMGMGMGMGRDTGRAILADTDAVGTSGAPGTGSSGDPRLLLSQAPSLSRTGPIETKCGTCSSAHSDDRISIVGFSQGTAVTFAALSAVPDVANRVHCMVALAPAISVRGLQRSIVSSLLETEDQGTMFRTLFGGRSMTPYAAAWQRILSSAAWAGWIRYCMMFLFGWSCESWCVP